MVFEVADRPGFEHGQKSVDDLKVGWMLRIPLQGFVRFEIADKSVIPDVTRGTRRTLVCPDRPGQCARNPIRKLIQDSHDLIGI